MKPESSVINLKHRKKNHNTEPNEDFLSFIHTNKGYILANIDDTEELEALLKQ